jgi:hypothetical protein
METRKKIGLAVLFTLILLLLGILFAPFVLLNILQPITLSVWLFLRMFVLSIGQNYYWGILIFLEVFFVFRRISKQPAVMEIEKPIDPNDTIRSVDEWRSSIRFSTSSSYERSTIKRNLTNMLVSLYTAKPPSGTFFDLSGPLTDGQMPLPEPVKSFFFAKEPELPKSFLLKKSEQARRFARDQIRHWTGQDTWEYYQSIDEVLKFMETSLEMEKDDQSS